MADLRSSSGHTVHPKLNPSLPNTSTKASLSSLSLVLQAQRWHSKHTADDRDRHITQTPFRWTERWAWEARGGIASCSVSLTLTALCSNARSQRSFFAPLEHVFVRAREGTHSENRPHWALDSTNTVYLLWEASLNKCMLGIWPKSRTTDRL